ncbi:hypothetical protein FN846DRAFT_903794 [Sphaerosporella brunnea]|uniref:Uncharacterized protein n=1 Tax=Sphaerosporella brunnea TaxID=1250544 RepID=A0A5J5F6R9_9PEZI|nr:hypothetical protein FN846DRAFT_903794 [Sphaerosporella brunnea]
MAMKPTSGESIDAWFVELVDIRNRLINTPEATSGMSFKTHIFNSLPKAFDVTAKILQNEPDLSAEAVIARLKLQPEDAAEDQVVAEDVKLPLDKETSGVLFAAPLRIKLKTADPNSGVTDLAKSALSMTQQPTPSLTNSALIVERLATSLPIAQSRSVETKLVRRRTSTAYSSEAMLSTAVSKTISDWAVDSAATDHMCNNKHAFTGPLRKRLSD